MKPPTLRIVRCRWSASDQSKWMVEGLRDDSGKRIRKFFPSRETASDWLASRRPELRDQGRAAMALTDEQRVDAVAALALLSPFKTTLTAAARAYGDRAKMLAKTVSVKDLREELVRTKKSDGLSVRYIGDLRARLAVFGQTFDSRPIPSIEPREVDDWLRGLDLAPTTRNNFRRILVVFFSFAIARGYARENPASQSAKAKERSTPPGILNPNEVVALLSCATPDILPSLALAAFAGLRDAEIGRMTWQHVDLVSGYIKIDNKVSKTSSRRLIPLSENLKQWLLPYTKAEGKIRMAASKVRPQILEARARAIERLKGSKTPSTNLRKWPHNALRHSYASYRLALLGDAARTALECGHSAAVLARHYMELVTKAEAERWFAVIPQESAPNVVAFPQRAAS